QDDGDAGGDEAADMAEAGVGHVHPEVAGDERGDGDDGGPAGDLLGDDVQPVALDDQVRLQDAVHQVAQAVGPLGDAQDVVVEVLVVGLQFLPDDVQVGLHQVVHHVAHGKHHPAQQHKALTQLEAAPLDLHAPRSAVEQLVLQPFGEVIQVLHRLELGIDDVVEQPVQQVADPGPGQIGAAVPPIDDGPDVQPVVFAHGDQRLAGDEGRELAGHQLTRAGVELGRVRGQEQVAGVAVKLGPLAVVQRVL